MKVFLSWSGERSKQVAEFLKTWIRCVMQATRPWLSSRDIASGSIWFDAIREGLEGTSTGIVCLTEENRQSPWVHFEVGALMKGLPASRVCMLLVDLQPSEVASPLSHFQLTRPNKVGMLSLVESINEQLKEGALDAMTLNTVFENYWPQFEPTLEKIKAATVLPERPAKRTADDMLAEILNVIRDSPVSSSPRLNPTQALRSQIFAPPVFQAKHTSSFTLLLSKAMNDARSAKMKGLSAAEVLDSLLVDGYTREMADQATATAFFDPGASPEK